MTEVTRILSAIQQGDPRSGSCRWSMRSCGRSPPTSWPRRSRARPSRPPPSFTKRTCGWWMRSKRSRKRGGNQQRIDLDLLAATSPPRHDDLLALDEVLAQLTAADPQAAQLVQLRYFTGLTVPEAAAVLGVSPRTADFLWAYARAFLLRCLGGKDTAG